MKLYEIKGFDKGVKVKRTYWAKRCYIFFDNFYKIWVDQDGYDANIWVGYTFWSEDWEVYKEKTKE